MLWLLPLGALVRLVHTRPQPPPTPPQGSAGCRDCRQSAALCRQGGVPPPSRARAQLRAGARGPGLQSRGHAAAADARDDEAAQLGQHGWGPARRAARGRAAGGRPSCWPAVRGRPAGVRLAGVRPSGCAASQGQARGSGRRWRAAWGHRCPPAQPRPPRRDSRLLYRAVRRRRSHLCNIVQRLPRAARADGWPATCCALLASGCC